LRGGRKREREIHGHPLFTFTLGKRADVNFAPYRKKEKNGRGVVIATTTSLFLERDQERERKKRKR